LKDMAAKIEYVKPAFLFWRVCMNQEIEIKHLEASDLPRPFFLPSTGTFW
jgi:hypothetical protein